MYSQCIRCIRQSVKELEAAPCSRVFSNLFCTHKVDEFEPPPSDPFLTTSAKCIAAQKAECSFTRGPRCLKCLRKAVADGSEDLKGCEKFQNDAFCQTGLPTHLAAATMADKASSLAALDVPGIVGRPKKKEQQVHSSEMPQTETKDEL